ncbi:MAG: hypothetical protein M3214_03500 [Actinomycetota bacterium]|nr:hypothetical protein [Actinomycetota bacterium]
MVVRPDEYKGALSKFASDVTIVTVSAGHELHGMIATGSTTEDVTTS